VVPRANSFGLRLRKDAFSTTEAVRCSYCTRWAERGPVVAVMDGENSLLMMIVTD
jgi:hypothetical protein